jgi:hypothetical protein
MNEVEELRSQLRHSSPEALERARIRLRAAQAAPTGAAARRRHPGRRTIRLGALGVIAVAAACAALLIGIGSGAGSGSGTGVGPLAPATASARTVLIHAAASAARADDGGIARLPRPDEFFYLEIRGTYRDGVGGGATRLDTRTYRSWQSETRTGREQSAADSAPGPLDPTPQWFIGNERFSHAKLAAFDPTPHALYERLLRGMWAGQGSSPHAEVFVQIVDALRQVPLEPRLRATFLRALAEIPGLRLTGTTKDSLGRPGLGVAYVETSRHNQQNELILGHDGALLAEREVAGDGTLLEDAVVVRQAITSGLSRPAR